MPYAAWKEVTFPFDYGFHFGISKNDLSAHFGLEIYIFKDELRHALPFLHFFHIKMRWSPVLIQTTTLFFVQKYKSWIVCPANSWKATRGGARQVNE